MMKDKYEEVIHSMLN